MAQNRLPRCVFVGNIPYDATEAELNAIFSEVGPVVSFRLVTERDSGKPKGYGFCEYRDHETASSAIRNLNNREFSGRPLRVDFAETDNKERSSNAPSVGADARATAGSVQGKPVTQQVNAILEGMSLPQLYELLSAMKNFIMANQAQARQILATNPQLSYALLQAMVILGMINPAVLQTLLNSRNAPPAPVVVPVPTPQPMHVAPPMAPVLAAPPPMMAPVAYPPAAPFQLGGMPPGALPPVAMGGNDEAKLLEQIMLLTPAQIDALPPQQRAQVQAILSVIRSGGR